MDETVTVPRAALRAALEVATAALNGDSNDAEHYALHDLAVLLEEWAREVPWEHGIHWAGDGSAVQRADDVEAYPGDMEAALVVAENGFPWLVYLPQSDDEPWQVCAFSDLDAAAEMAADDGAFVFDGRRGTPPSGPDGVGYVEPDAADAAPMTDGRAWRKGEPAPAGLECVEVTLYPGCNPTARGDRRIRYWVGLNEQGAVDVDAAVQRAEVDNPGWYAQDWGAA